MSGYNLPQFARFECDEVANENDERQTHFMKIVALFIAILVACGGSVSAQAGKVEVPTTKINYSRAVPAAVWKQMPRKGKSRFFGISPLKYKGQAVLIHLYDVKPTDSSPNRASYGVKNYAPDERKFQAGPLEIDAGKNPSNYYGVQSCAFDVFLRRGKTRLRRIQSVRFNYVRYVGFGDAETVGVNLTWLDPKTRLAPIFNINFREQGIEGPAGVNMLVIFPNGLARKPVVEGFSYGADNSTDSNSWGWDFGAPDAKGLVTIDSYFDERWDETLTHLQWNGQNWAQTEQTKKDLSGP